MPKYPFIEFPLLVLMIFGPFTIIGSRMSPDGNVKGIGARVIQLISLIVLLPLAGILALEGILSGDSAGALIGVAIGYTLSGIEKPVPRRENGANKRREPTLTGV
jgi:hypothetical protein